MKVKIFPAILASVMLVPWAWAAAPQATPSADPGSEKVQRCLQLSRLDRTEVLNDHQILFQTQGHKSYVNTLPYPCPGMRRDSTLMFRTSIDLVCDVDVVTIVDQLGWGLQPRASCGLGKFDPVDEDEVKQLRNAARGGDAKNQ